MKLTLEQVENKMAQEWVDKAIVVPYRIPGNRFRTAVTDQEDRRISLETSWEGYRQVFEPA
jgi:hypothetical protein